MESRLNHDNYDEYGAEEKKQEDPFLASTAATMTTTVPPVTTQQHEEKSFLHNNNNKPKKEHKGNQGPDEHANDDDNDKDSKYSGTNESKNKNKKSSVAIVFLGGLMRMALLDFPLLLVFALYTSTTCFERFGKDYLVPQMSLQKWSPSRREKELTYYHRKCTPDAQTATDTSELIVTDDMTTQDAVSMVLKHGAAVFPNLISPETAHELREFILEQNARGEEMIYVIENANRWSFYVQVDQHPTIPKALNEILNNAALVPALEGIMGPNPAVIEFTSITSAYGAVGQFWHADVIPGGNAMKYGRNFVPSYSLFIPLQNTTAAMGATELCPGTHMCPSGPTDFCVQTGFQASGRANNWPQGYGALVNQQTAHRGTAHDDPDGPHRVLFILTFAPRPRFGRRQVETCLIGQSGSYSLHWSQWGHALRDFQDAAARMAQPWRTLRSLGLYKPAHQDWGWDYFTQVCARIVNNDVGFDEDAFDTFAAAGGLTFLPRFLQGSLNADETPRGMSPWLFFATETVLKVQAFMKTVYKTVLMAYLVTSIFLMAVFRQSRGKLLRTTILRLIVIHVVVAIVAGWTLHRIANSSWGRNIVNGRQYTVPHYNTFPKLMNVEDELRTTLPLEQDVLVLDAMQSEYLASFNQVLDVVHPGNRAFHQRIDANSQGYRGLTPSLQQQLRQSLLQWTSEAAGRILVQDAANNWAVVSDHFADWFCHKELMKRSSPAMLRAVQFLDFLLAETRFGYFRNTALHRQFIPLRLMQLQDHIIGQSRIEPSSDTDKKNIQRSFGMTLNGVNLTKKPSAAAHNDLWIQRSQGTGRPPRPPVKEPFDGAWFEQDDIVEATYQGEFEEWYRAVITSARANRYKYTVEYEDGDVDKSMCSNCVRPFVPYKVGERIEMRVGPSKFKEGHIVDANEDDDSYTVRLRDNNRILHQVETARIRRRTLAEYPPGTVVTARFPGDEDGEEDGEEWYSGYIVTDHKDGTFAIQYDDGDYAERVRRSDIKHTSVEEEE